MKKFTKEDLVEKLGLTEEKASLVMKAQREFPELLENEGEGFCINSRTMWEQFNKPQGEYKKWIKRKVLDKNYKEKEDFIRVDKIVDMPNKAQKTIEDYYFTVNCAKKVGMRENTNEGDLICDYFIYLEEAIKQMGNWTIIREPEKQGYKEMEDEIANWCDRNGFDKSIRTFYTREANMLNESLTGLNAQGIKLRLGYKDKNTRDHLQEDINKALYELQILNKGLLSADLPFETRKNIITQTCKTKYEHLILTTE